MFGRCEVEKWVSTLFIFFFKRLAPASFAAHRGQNNCSGAPVFETEDKQGGMQIYWHNWPLRMVEGRVAKAVPRWQVGRQKVGGESHKTEEEWIVDGAQLDKNKIMDYEAFAGGGETTQSTGSVYRSADNLQANEMRGDAMRGGE